ncbi:branched-chain amino acid aminotransferase [Cohaesibacter celericrescens]|uniref:branched-chain amino acid aminotransferase n=1 Tax=Cohaesibacter celericrescens TaxID=2067669 RepID=UPI003564F8A6
MTEFSKTWTWYKGDWHEGNPPLMGPRAHAFWLGSSVFDGARVFEGVMPDLDLHCARTNNSARTMGMNPTMEAGAIVELTKEGAAKFDPDIAIYVRPTYWGVGEGLSVITADPDDIDFCLTMFEAPMKKSAGMRITTTSFRRPTVECMPVNAKAGCLYPNNARCLKEAIAKGFDNAIVCDMLGNVAELATANVFIVKDGIVKTPVPNGTFLNGITRQRVIQLLTAAGIKVVECTLSIDDCRDADEMFSTGNYSKVAPIVAFDDREFGAGPMSAKAKELYWEFAHK